MTSSWTARAQPLGGPAPAFGVPAADVDGVAGGDESAGGLEAETLVRSGDQCRCHGSTMRAGLPRSARRPVFLGLPVPGRSAGGGAQWRHGDHGVRAGGAALARPGLPGGRRAACRSRACRPPDTDHRVRRLIAELRANSDLFAELWDSGAVGDRPAASRKTVDHPQVGPLTLDCDVLNVAGADLRIMLYTAEPGTEDAERLALLAVLGTQSLVESAGAGSVTGP